MKREDLDRISEGIRKEKMDATAAEEAAARVSSKLFPHSAGSADRIRGCADFQTLIPAYLDKSLSPARAMLLEDHFHQCVECRHAVEAARPGNVQTIRRPVVVQRRQPVTAWAVAAALAITVGLGSWMAFRRAFPPAGTRAVVESVNGVLYRVTDHGAAAIAAGGQIGDKEDIRTAKGSSAMVRLTDGSTIEMNERADLSVSRGWRGVTINLDRGDIIVHAAKQHEGRLYVSARDCLVSVKGTTFAVNRGTKGSRVSVVEGEVQMDHGDQSQLLHPGDQATTDPSLTKVPVADEIAWSRNAAEYLAQLGEFVGLQKRIEAIPAQGLRYSSKLVHLLPANTVLYAAIPNVGATLGEANRLFQERLQESEVLREWWNKQQHGANGPKLADIIEKLRSFSDYLGDEIVLAAGTDGTGGLQSPVLMAEVKKPGLRDFIEQQVRETGAGPVITMVDGPAVARSGRGMLVMLKNDMMAVAAEPRQLQVVAGAMERAGSGRLVQTPFYARIAQSYQKGAGWLLCADMEQIVASSVHHEKTNHVTGIGGVKYLVVERRENGGQTENRAVLSFSEQRQGLASWLAAPAPMGTLDFVSQDAGFAASFVIKNPRTLMEELLSALQTESPDFAQHLTEFESETGISVLNDLAAPFGGEFTFALDGAILPTPSWKIAVEVYDPNRLEWTLEKMVSSFNQKASAHQGSGKPNLLHLDQEQFDGRTYYTLRSDNSSLEVHYVFVDSYMVAAPSRAMLTTAIKNRDTGYTLTSSPVFRAQLPHDGHTNFSGIVYQNLGSMVAPLIEQLKSSNALTPAQRASIQQLTDSSAPGLIYAYADPDQITVASTGSFFGLNLGMLLGLSGDGPFVIPQIMRGALNPGAHLRKLTEQ